MLKLSNPHGTATRQDLVTLFDSFVALLRCARDSSGYGVTPDHSNISNTREKLIASLNSPSQISPEG